MRKLGHWTPRYVVNRLLLELHERRHPRDPWLTPDAVELLDGLLLPTDTGMEWGSGRSTAWLARRLQSLTSVEDDPVWHERVRSQLAEQGLTNVRYVSTPRPVDDETAWESLYVLQAKEIPDGSLGFALVDGSARAYCAQMVIPKMAPGGVLTIDNINWFLDHPTHSPTSRYRQGPRDVEWEKVAALLTDWRCVWTSSGVTDTAIWIKPTAKSAAALRPHAPARTKPRAQPRTQK